MGGYESYKHRRTLRRPVFGFRSRISDLRRYADHPRGEYA